MAGRKPAASAAGRRHKYRQDPRRNPSRVSKFATSLDPSSKGAHMAAVMRSVEQRYENALTPSDASSSRASSIIAKTRSRTLANAQKVLKGSLPSRRRSAHKEEPATVSPRSNKRRHARSQRSYEEDATEEEMTEEDQGYLSTPDVKKLPGSGRPVAKRRRKRTAAKPPTFKLDLLSQHNGVAPDWLDPRIEHSIWCQIVSYAAPSPEDSPQSILAYTRWLAGVARVCRAFAEPAFTVLYRDLKIKDEATGGRLESLLSLSPSTTAFNYRTKVESISIDPTSLALSGRINNFTTISFFRNLPRLTNVIFSSATEGPPYRMLDDAIKWQYPEELFAALASHNGPDAQPGEKTMPTILRSWQWSSRMLQASGSSGSSISLQRVLELHHTPTFAHLRSLRMTNFQIPSLRLTRGIDSPEVVAADNQFIDDLGTCIGALSRLEHLALECSTAVNDRLLSHVPLGLKRLEIVNCWEVDSECLIEFLMARGDQLESLVLNHNQSLNLAFLTVLGRACPKLKELRMDLSTFRHHTFYDDSKPIYDNLILASEVPDWPRALQNLTLTNMREWESEAATMFFQSLINSARRLPMLRRIFIRAMLSIPWRQRSDFRKEWQAKLDRVFLRPTEQPNPWHRLSDVPTSAPDPIDELARHPNARRSGRLAEQTTLTSSRSSSSAAETPARSAGRFQDSDTEESGLDEDAMEIDSRPAKKPFVQGRCHVVHISLDNQHRVEQPFGFEDFVDSEGPESDDGWYEDRSQ